MKSTFWPEVNAALRTEKLLEVLLQRAKQKKEKKDSFLKEEPHEQPVPTPSANAIRSSRAMKRSMDPSAPPIAADVSKALERNDDASKPSKADDKTGGWIGKFRKIREVKG